MAKLNTDRMKNSFLIHTLETEEAPEFHFSGNSAAVREKNTGFWLFSLDKKGDFTELYNKIEGELGTFYVNSSEYFDEVQSNVRNATAQDYIQYVLESSEYRSNSASVNPEVTVVPLDQSWVGFILSLYKSAEFGNEEYISACIDKHPGFGALVNGERVGYVTIHLDGEIGSMVISEKARGKGVGRTLMQYITPKYAEQASIGCGFVLPENSCSQKMMVNSCFTALKDKIMWVYH